MNTDFLHRLLALHYVLPLPYNKLEPLLEDDPQLEYLRKRTVLDFAHGLNVPFEQAQKYKELVGKSLQKPFLNLYEKHSISPLPYSHPSYPKSLYNLIDPPAVLYTKGDSALLVNEKRIAVIGSRKASGYSQSALDALIPPVVKYGYTIVSGLAKGADAMAHKTAIDAGGRTIAVTGSGFNHPYPKENSALQYIMEENQLVVTEYPPYMTPKKWHFPMRNRIISGLSKGVVVTEAELKSGTLSTVEHALDHGKDIFSVPGPIVSGLSAGPNRLISEGAKLVWNGAQIVEEYEELIAEK